MTEKNSPAAADNDILEREPRTQLALVKRNYVLMAVACVVILVGFLLMLGGSSTAEEFNPDIFSTRRIVVGPSIAFLGFLFMGVAIMWPDKSSDSRQ